ncbi:hypothetical protein FRC10_005682, partial [Ceratobasidium sp. 414]
MSFPFGGEEPVLLALNLSRKIPTVSGKNQPTSLDIMEHRGGPYMHFGDNLTTSGSLVSTH